MEETRVDLSMDSLNKYARKLDFVDALKFIGSVLIFTMHSNVCRDNEFASFLLEIAARWGVPFFFICSSYLLFRKSVNGTLEKKYIIQYIKRISLLYLCWLIYNLPSVFYNHLYEKRLLDVSTWMIFAKNAILSSTFTGSWYLVSSIFSAFFVYSLSKKISTKMIIILSLVPFLICVFTSAYQGVLPKKITSMLSFLCFPLNIFNGCFCFSLGKYISENEIRITKIITKKRAVCLIALFYLIYVAELCFTKRFGIFASSDVAFSIALVAFFVFLFCIQIPISIGNNILLRKLSIIIYCGQGNILILGGVCRTVWGISPIITYFLCVFLMIGISTLVLVLQKNKSWKWLKYLT